MILALGPVGGTENGEDCVLCECDGRVVKEEQGGERVESEYGPHGLRVRMRTSRGHVLEIERDIVKKIIDGLRGPVSFEHDGLGNLTAAVYGDGEVDLRMPDRVGNLFRTGERKDRKYGPAGQLLESVSKAGTTRYAYDPEGNLVKKTLPDGSAWTYEWNAAGMLAKVIRPDGKVVAFGYDALGRRVWKTYKGKTTRWVWDGNVPVHEWVEVEEPAVSPAPERIEDSQDAGIRQRGIDLSQRHTQGPPTLAIQHGTADAPITWVFDPESFAPAARLAGGEQHAIITDHLGTPTAMLDVAGRPVWSADIGIWGELRNLVGDKQACPFRWPGQYEDEETGLYYNRFRYYDPDSGEYVTQDPIGLRGGLALHGYVCDPLGFVDTLGLKSCGAKKPIIIGENMGRVDRFAKAIDGETITDWLKGRAWSQKLNDEFIEAMKKEGREIHDIGPDFARRATGKAPSAVYGGERKALKGYSNYTRWFQRSGKRSGGVPNTGIPGFN